MSTTSFEHNVITIETNVIKTEDGHTGTQIGSDHLQYVMWEVNEEARIQIGYFKKSDLDWGGTVV